MTVAIPHTNANRVYALIETGDGVLWNGNDTDTGHLWRSDDGGANWRMINTDRNAMGRTAYYARMAVSTDNENETYYLNASFSRSIDGGATLVATNGLEAPGGDPLEEDFSVRMAAPATLGYCADALECGPELLVIVDFAVEREDEPSIGRMHRLAPGR